MEKFVRFREVLQPSGVYALLRGGRVVYVGKSKNVFARLAKHYTNQKRVLRGLPTYDRRDVGAGMVRFDDVLVKFCSPNVLDAEEVKLIQEHLPEHNSHHCVQRYDLRNVPAFQEMLRRARERNKVEGYFRRGF